MQIRYPSYHVKSATRNKMYNKNTHGILREQINNR